MCVTVCACLRGVLQKCGVYQNVFYLMYICFVVSTLLVYYFSPLHALSYSVFVVFVFLCVITGLLVFVLFVVFTFVIFVAINTFVLVG